jgi:cell cycle serine/threonine-protein kinase CDC5/MSD2
MALELYQDRSLMSMLYHHYVFRRPEPWFFMVQLISACHYMHTHQVIHLNLKLDDLFP